ncbi:MAG: prepilin-type N-terminal cleavage/methylation domain-containing protein [Bacilli bacterium]|nr:prepilin-type N-terminal cleavage/methylation domain-containing protein [Bacilli bacterium]MDD4608191.1 prepilin-type N-terminal cleavage/methylation domain-containing protein [Bacilli bacterium]
MKENNGFTLIELLAVIVILAIIALIAAPIIVGLIDDARREAAANSAYGVYHAAENVYAKVLIANQSGLPDSLIYTFDTDGITIGYGDALTTTPPAEWGIDAADATLDFKGTIPTGGVLTLNNNGTVAVTTDLIINNYTCTKGTNDIFTCS